MAISKAVLRGSFFAVLIIGTAHNVIASEGSNVSSSVNHHIGAEFGDKNVVLSYTSYNSGLYATLRFDSNKYELDNRVSVCNDGGISGSTGSGTCSGHGGVSHTRNEVSDRVGGSVGYMWNAIDNIYFGGGIAYGFYGTEVNVGSSTHGDGYINVEGRAAYRLTERFSVVSTYEGEGSVFTFGATYGF